MKTSARLFIRSKFYVHTNTKVFDLSILEMGYFLIDKHLELGEKIWIKGVSF